MKSLLTSLLLLFCLPMGPLFALHEDLEKANELYWHGDYKEAYRAYSDFLYFEGKDSSDADYYSALIGSSSCIYHMNTADILLIDAYRMEYIVTAEIPCDKKKLLLDTFQEKLYSKPYK